MIHDENAERALLGCVLQEPTIVRRFPLEPLDFASTAHGQIWDALLSIERRGGAIDHLTLATELQARGHLGSVGGAAYLMKLDTAIPFAANAESYVAIVRDRAQRRRVVELAKDLARKVEDLNIDPAEVLAGAAGELARTGAGSYRVRTLADVNAEVFQRMNRVQDGQEEPVIRTGLKALDNAIGGLQPTLIVVGGRTGGGKSALGAALIKSLSLEAVPGGVFSLEDSADWLTYRYLAADSGVPNFVIRFRRKLDDEWLQIGQAAPKLSRWDHRIFVDDTPNLNTRQIIARATDMVVNRGARYILIDHLQEIEHDDQPGDRHELKIRRSLQELRSFANRFQVPVVLLAQAKEHDGTRKPGEPPSIFDFADAPNAIAKISRVAMIVTTDPENEEMDVWIVKHTNGHNRSVVKFRFLKAAGLAAPAVEKPETPDLFGFTVARPPPDDDDRDDQEVGLPE